MCGVLNGSSRCFYSVLFVVGFCVLLQFDFLFSWAVAWGWVHAGIVIFLF